MTNADIQNATGLDPGRARLMRHIALVVGASLVSGAVVGGIGGRVVMRIIAVAADDRRSRRSPTSPRV